MNDPLDLRTPQEGTKPSQTPSFTNNKHHRDRVQLILLTLIIVIVIIVGLLLYSRKAHSLDRHRIELLPTSTSTNP